MPAWRLSLLNEFSLEPLQIKRITKPVLIVVSGADRIFPSEMEADRLIHYLPNAQKTILPNSGHACLLETEVRLGDILQLQHFL